MPGRGWMDTVPAQILRKIRPRNGPRGSAGVAEAVGGGIRVHRCHQTVHIENLHAGLACKAVPKGAVHRLRKSGPKIRRRRPVGGNCGREAHVGDTPHGDVHRAFALQGVNDVADVRRKLQRGRGDSCRGIGATGDCGQGVASVIAAARHHVEGVRRSRRRTQRRDEGRRLLEEARRKAAVVHGPRLRAAVGVVCPQSSAKHRAGHLGLQPEHRCELIRPNIAVAVLVRRGVGIRRDERVGRDIARQGDTRWRRRRRSHRDRVVSGIRKTVAKNVEPVDGGSSDQVNGDRSVADKEPDKRTNDRVAVAVFHATDLVMDSAELFDELRWRTTDACSEHIG